MIRFILGTLTGLILGLNFPIIGLIANNLVHDGGVLACSYAESQKCESAFDHIFAQTDAPGVKELMVQAAAKEIAPSRALPKQVSMSDENVPVEEELMPRADHLLDHGTTSRH